MGGDGQRGVEGKQEISEEGQVRDEKVYKISEEGGETGMR